MARQGATSASVEFWHISFAASPPYPLSIRVPLVCNRQLVTHQSAVHGPPLSQRPPSMARDILSRSTLTSLPCIKQRRQAYRLLPHAMRWQATEVQYPQLECASHGQAA